MVKCNKCGLTVDDSFELCPNCGNNLNDENETPVELNKCKECGSEVSTDQKFCPTCGAKFQMADVKACSNCGNQLEADEEFCPECGTPANSQSAAVSKVKYCVGCGSNS